MIGRNKRGVRKGSMRVRLAVAAAVLVGGGAAGVVAISANHGTVNAQSSAYNTSYNHTYTESQAMSKAMNWWSRSPQTSLSMITQMVPIRTVSTSSWHNHTLAVQRGTVVAKDPGVFVVKSTSGQFELWHFNNGTKFLNIGGNKTGWNAMSGGMMSSSGSYNWSNSSNSQWNMRTKTVAKGDLVFVFGLRVHGKLQAQLVLFAAPSQVNQFVTPTATPSMTTAPNTNGLQAPVPAGTTPTFSGTHS
ncbi:MAG: hypothetical protein ACRDOI_42300 [Trebonia sp.]